jgi:hypothetical protein
MPAPSDGSRGETTITLAEAIQNPPRIPIVSQAIGGRFRISAPRPAMDTAKIAGAMT